MNVSLGTFFWLSIIYIYIKYNSTPAPYLDAFFFITVVIFMYFINTNTMTTTCGSMNSWVVFKSTFFPWVIIFGTMMFALRAFPGWKAPFSNTFGFIIARLAGGNAVLFKLLKPQGTDKTIEYIYSDPSLLINQFSYSTFDADIAKPAFTSIRQQGESTDPLKKIIYLKDLISEWIWYLLTASIVITTSNSMIMNTECTKSLDDYVASHNTAMVNSNVDSSDETRRIYTSTE